MAQKRKLVPALQVNQSPSGIPSRCDEREAVLLEYTPSGSNLRVWRPPATPCTPSTPSTSSAKKLPPKKSRRSLKHNEITELLMNSGSEDDSEEGDVEDEEAINIISERTSSRSIRNESIMLEEEIETEGMAEARGAGDANKDYEGLIVVGASEEVDIDGILGQERVIGTVGEGLEQPTLAQVYEGLDVFTWSEDFSTFFGQAETYLRTPGPTEGSHDPVEIFLSIWDREIVQKIVDETNLYAWQQIAVLSENGIPDYLMPWGDGISVEELYLYFAVLILMSLCYRSKLVDYWTTGIMEMPKFRNVISKNRFLLITKFLHFTNNEEMSANLSSYDKKIYKIRPVIDHCNKKFASLYIPNKHLSLDESLLLWKGRLSWVQCIRTKAARFGIKSYELCEAATGYQLRCLLYAGKESTMSEKPIHGFVNCTAKVVLELMDGFLDVGHTLVMDNWYNQLPLTRFLKRRKTDVIGTMNRRQVHVPDDIKNVKESELAKGEQIARHCGDISVVTWKDVKLVTAVSTHHSDNQVPARRAGQDIKKPEAIDEYNKYMGGVDSKDQKLSMFLMERKRAKKWYMKVFKRQLNTSLLNAFIIYTKHPILKPMTHREFRNEVALGLLSKFSVQSADTEKHSSSQASSSSVLDKHKRRLMPGKHFVEHTEKLSGTNQHKRLRCVRCTAAGRRNEVTLRCTFCGVALCVGSCWAEYHELENLK